MIKSGHSNYPIVELEVNVIPITSHVDTQAEITVITEKHYKAIHNGPLQITKAVRRRKAQTYPYLAMLARRGTKMQETVKVA